MNLADAASVTPSRIRLIAGLADEHPGTARLFVGEDTHPTPDFIKQAALRAIADNKTYYTPNAGYPEFRRAVADHTHRLHGVAIDPDRQVLATASGMNAIALACQATVGPGRSALVLSPLWPNMAAAIRVTGAEPIEVPFQLGPDGFQLDEERMERAVRPDTRLLALASPGNPTGWTASLDDWKRLLAFCKRHNLWLLADGVYERIVFQGDVAPCPLSLPEAAERTFVTQSFSKAYRMTGWRIGYVIAPISVGPTLCALQEFAVSHAPGIQQEAARVALLEGELFIEESRQRYARHREICIERLRSIDGLALPKPGGAFYVFPRMEGLADSLDFCRYLIREWRVGVAPGSAFGEGGEGHVRICFAVDEAILIDALDRFHRGWDAYREGAASWPTTTAGSSTAATRSTSPSSKSA